jgi:hypothetical protein
MVACLTASLTVAQTPTPTPTVNTPPQVFVDGEADFLGGGAFLFASAVDDGLNRALSYYWTKVSGPGTVTWGNQQRSATRARFSAKGLYVLQCTVSDGQYIAVDHITVLADDFADISCRP